MLKFEKKVRRQKVKTTTAAATATENGPYSATSTVPAVYILTQQAATLNTWRTVRQILVERRIISAGSVRQTDRPVLF